MTDITADEISDGHDVPSSDNVVSLADRPRIVLPEGFLSANDDGTPADPEPQDLTPQESFAAALAEIGKMSLDQLLESTAVVQMQNQQVARSLQQNYGAGLDPMSVLMQRLEAIILHLEPLAQARINFTFEQAVHTALVDAERQVRIQVLTQGLEGPGVPQMPSPGGRLPNGRPRPRR